MVFWPQRIIICWKSIWHTLCKKAVAQCIRYTLRNSLFTQSMPYPPPDLKGNNLIPFQNPYQWLQQSPDWNNGRDAATKRQSLRGILLVQRHYQKRESPENTLVVQRST